MKTHDPVPGGFGDTQLEFLYGSCSRLWMEPRNSDGGSIGAELVQKQNCGWQLSELKPRTLQSSSHVKISMVQRC